MTPLQAILFGLIQGLTEFLPVSSSGHLALAQAAFGWGEPVLALDVAVHAATVGAVVVVLRRDVMALVRGALDVLRGRFRTEDARLLGLIVLGTIPAGVVGLTLRHSIEAAFASPVAAAIGLLVTGAILLLVRFATDRDRRIGPAVALAVGLAQAVAIMPGISRSGSTIAVALWLGVAAPRAFSFSFLLSIPAILGATVLVLPEALGAGGEPGLAATCLTAAAAAFLCGVAALHLLRGVVESGRLPWFAPYCFALGALALVLLSTS